MDRNAKAKMKQQLQSLRIREALETYSDTDYYDALVDLYESGRGDACIQSSNLFADYAQEIAKKDPVIACVIGIVAVAAKCAETGERFPEEELYARLPADLRVKVENGAVN